MCKIWGNSALFHGAAVWINEIFHGKNVFQSLALSKCSLNSSPSSNPHSTSHSSIYMTWYDLARVCLAVQELWLWVLTRCSAPICVFMYSHYFVST